MTLCHRALRAFGADHRALTALEYGIIVGVMSVGLVSAISIYSGKLTTALNLITF
jgi:Flp pilus assembly pilin Flp